EASACRPVALSLSAPIVRPKPWRVLAANAADSRPSARLSLVLNRPVFVGRQHSPSQALRRRKETQRRPQEEYRSLAQTYASRIFVIALCSVGWGQIDINIAL